jgi:hypothetical protein
MHLERWGDLLSSFDLDGNAKSDSIDDAAQSKASG